VTKIAEMSYMNYEVTKHVYRKSKEQAADCYAYLKN